jgi:hypothetical protein
VLGVAGQAAHAVGAAGELGLDEPDPRGDGGGGEVEDDVAGGGAEGEIAGEGEDWRKTARVAAREDCSALTTDGNGGMSGPSKKNSRWIVLEICSRSKKDSLCSPSHGGDRPSVCTGWTWLVLRTHT